MATSRSGATGFASVLLGLVISLPLAGVSPPCHQLQDSPVIRCSVDPCPARLVNRNPHDTGRASPIGSMGDGMWRMLGLALALVSAENGILLVDEIDTGLHFTVLEKMWKLIDEASRRLNVQVFATTHSRDAYESLATISRESVTAGSEVTIQRIDRFKSKSVAFTEQEIIASSERGTEVR